MESYCNNCNSMNRPRSAAVYNRDSLGVGNGQAANCCDHMSQQCRREGNMERRQREGCVEQCKRIDSCKYEESVRPCAQETRQGTCTDRNKMQNRSVEVECVCKVNPVVSCHRHDEMEHLGCEFPVVMAYVPWQQWGDLYEVECGLMQGTIFKELNFIFCGERC